MLVLHPSHHRDGSAAGGLLQVGKEGKSPRHTAKGPTTGGSFPLTSVCRAAMVLLPLTACQCCLSLCHCVWTMVPTPTGSSARSL